MQLFHHSLHHGKLPMFGNLPLLSQSINMVNVPYLKIISVSLTSILVKSLEGIINKHIMKFLSHHRPLSENQNGSREV